MYFYFPSSFALRFDGTSLTVAAASASAATKKTAAAAAIAACSPCTYVRSIPMKVVGTAIKVAAAIHLG